MFEFPQNFTLPVDDWVDALMDWILMVFGPFFEALSDVHSPVPAGHRAFFPVDSLVS